MEDRDEKASRSKPLVARVRSALGGMRRQGASSLDGVRRSVVGAGERLKSTQAAERLGSAVETRRLIKKAADAQRRGNHAMAYRLLEPEVREKGDDVRLVVAFWNAALACERAEDAVPAVVHIIRRLAIDGKPDRAAALWMELREAAPTALVDPSALVRIAPALQADGQPAQAVKVLREAVDPRNSGLSPGLAVRVAEMARELDPASAVTAARRALESPDLDEAKRARLQSLVRQLEKAKAGPSPQASAEAPAPAKDAERPREARPPPAPADSPHGTGTASADPGRLPKDSPRPAAEAARRAVGEALEAQAPAARFADIKLTEGMPTGLLKDAVAFQLLAGRKAGLEYAKIEALAVAEVKGLAPHPVVVVDLVLNWRQTGDPVLRAVRFRSDGFDARMLISPPTDAAEAFRSFLSELLARSRAVPLPDPDSALGVNVRAFDSVAAYQREVLAIEP